MLQTAKCYEKHQQVSALPGSIPRANPDELLAIFNKYASVEKSGRKFMTANDFVQRYLNLYNDENYNRETVRLLASAADTSKDGIISFEEFFAFEATLCSPDALYLTAFEIFDNNASESITADEFEKVIRHTTPLMQLDFDFNCEFIKKYFGAFDKENDGSISANDFYTIMTTVKGHLLTDFSRQNLIAVAGGGSSAHKVRFPFYQAFNSLLAKMELMKRVYMSISRGNIGLMVTREEFLQATQAYAQITPYEVEILFRLAELNHPGTRAIDLSDLDKIDPERLKRVSQIFRITNVKAVKNKEDRGFGVAVLESMYRFLLGAMGGTLGASAVYPIDLVKTRMQNQRSGSYLGEVMYKNSYDCFKKVVKFEGILGLYRGLLPQIMGVAPEKAIKLTANDFVRDKFTKDGRIPLYGEILAGFSAGTCQVAVTNPLEIIKIRLQTAGEIINGPKVRLLDVIKDLGFKGLYKGSRACWLRDIPFSGIYFPVYAHMKLLTADSQGLNSPYSLLASAMIAGVPAAALVTPADVIKTRLQVASRAGQTTYTGVIDCFRKVKKEQLLHEEGPSSFWKGATARVFRSSPQFGVTLLSYELLQRVFYVDFGGTRPSGSETSTHATMLDQASANPHHIGGYKLAAATFSGIEHKFGLFLPRFERRSDIAVTGQ
uniref:EF-hand domain-containing protein n=2 Tax=Meloidogyne incognita group TaxID=654580 RepID=A0A915MNI9_MELJA